MSDEQDQEPRERLIEELENFEEIARYLNPSPGETPDLPGIDICGVTIPLRRDIGGDHLIYIDFNHRYDLDGRIARAEKEDRQAVADQLRRLKQRAGILIADVSGHRMTDALLAAMLHQAFLLGVYYELDMFGQVTTKIFEQINTRFHRTTAVNKYFTMIYGEISTNGKFRFLSAGHQPPAVHSREYRRFMKISPDRLIGFPPVGMLPSSGDPDDRINTTRDPYKKSYAVNEIDLLSPGDILLLHTDGLAEHAGGRFFPRELERLLGSCGDLPASEICSRIREALLRLGPPEDDVSFVVIRRT